MKARERQLHLRFDPYRPHDVEVERRLDEILEQGRLADPSLAAQEQGTALAAADRLEQVVQHGALVRPPEQAGVPTRSPTRALHRGQR